MTLGGVTTLTPDEARKAARDVLASVQLGADPAGDRRKGREMPTVAELLNQYLTEEVGPKRKPRTAELYRYYARNLVVPELGPIKAPALTKAEVARLHRKLGKDRPITANRVLALVSSLYGFAASHVPGIAQGFNPAKGIKKFPEEGRERFLSTDDLQRLGATLRQGETIGFPWRVDEGKLTSKHLAAPERRRTQLNPMVIAALRLLLFTGCRLREILHLEWRDVDFERGMLFLRDSKTGRKPVILNAPALAVLETLPRLGTFVIAGDAPDKPRSDLKRPWQAVLKHANLEGLRIHDLRHSFASVGAGAGMGLPIVGRLLGHAQASTTQRYAHLDADPLRRASDTIGATLAAAMGGKPSGEVVPLPKPAKGA
jgi:integrase